MRERKFVKLRVDMPDDTKFKIIDMKPERDLIHYVWYRLVLLCGKVNLDGELYMSKNIPYTVETLAIEFNRDVNQVELALKVLIQLEMVELTEHKVYCVINFAKHQNIKAKEKDKEIKEETNSKNEEAQINADVDNKQEQTKAIEVDNNIDGKEDNNPKNSSKLLDMKMSKKTNLSTKKDTHIRTKEENGDSMASFYEGDKRRLGKDESLVAAWSF